MAKEKGKEGKKENKERKSQETEKKEEKAVSCNDAKCPLHGGLSTRGRVFEGNVIKKFNKRVVIAFERVVYIKKYERYAKSRTRLHARLPDCLQSGINVGDYIQVRECRPLSKMIKFVVMKRIERKK